MLPIILAVVAAILLAAFQTTYGPGTFEYQQFHPHTGQLLLEPYPVLFTDQKAIPLVSPGKHGSGPLFAGLDRQRVSLNASRIYRNQDEMLEVVPESIHPVAGTQAIPELESIGTYTLEGEIVDSKCFLGVMNPGSGRVHRECAVRCIKGGVPQIFVVRDRTGKSQALYLTNLGQELHNYIAEPVRIEGQLLRRSNLLYFRLAGISRR